MKDKIVEILRLAHLVNPVLISDGRGEYPDTYLMRVEDAEEIGVMIAQLYSTEEEASLEDVNKAIKEFKASEKWDEVDLDEEEGFSIGFQCGVEWLKKLTRPTVTEGEKSNVFKRDNCIFKYCPNPELCKDECQNTVGDFEDRCKENDKVFDKMRDISNIDMNESYGNLTRPTVSEIDKTIERIEDMHPYKEAGNRDSYSQYNEGWSDACDILGQAIKKLTRPTVTEGESYVTSCGPVLREPVKEMIFLKSENQSFPLGSVLTSKENGELIIAPPGTPKEKIVGTVGKDGRIH